MAHDDTTGGMYVPNRNLLLEIAEHNPNLLHTFQNAAQEAIDRGRIPKNDPLIVELLKAVKLTRPELLKVHTLTGSSAAGPSHCANKATRPKVVRFDIHRRKR